MEESNDELESTTLRRAILAFQQNFSMYVKEMDINLWRRGMDYARTYTESEHVDFMEHDGERRDEGKEEQDSGQ